MMESRSYESFCATLRPNFPTSSYAIDNIIQHLNVKLQFSELLKIEFLTVSITGRMAPIHPNAVTSFLGEKSFFFPSHQNNCSNI
jgi:hypothetical protein